MKRVTKLCIPFCAVVLTWFAFGRAIASNEPSFAEWLQELRQEATASGISEPSLDAALSRVRYNDLVIKLDRNQPEFKLTLADYLERVINSTRIRKGRELLAEHGAMLAAIQQRYGVPARFLVALWGIETDFGRVTGSFPVIEALATLAYDPRRSAFFRSQLLDSLRIVDQGHLSPKQMEGSWAGAMGYLQFLPSVFLKYGVDFDQDGRITIFQAHPDLFASGANYLAASGWQRGWTWGREVLAPSDLNPDLLGLKHQKSLHQWHSLGLRRIGGTFLPEAGTTASLIKPDSSTDRYFLVYTNFQVLMKWNRSTYYGVAVGLLADHIQGVDVQ